MRISLLMLALVLAIPPARGEEIRWFGVLPAGVPDTTEWWKIDGGRLRITYACADYRVYLDPADDGYWVITRYRAMPLIYNRLAAETTCDAAKRGPERLQFIDKRRPLDQRVRRFVLKSKRDWRRLWLKKSKRWKEIPEETPAFRAEDEMTMLVNVDAGRTVDRLCKAP